jgi:hypothetical protein
MASGNGDYEGENGIGHVEELDESDDIEVVEFEDEDGVTHQTAILAVIELGDSQYAVLAPVQQLVDENGEELELFLFEYGEDEEGNEFFSYIEDEQTFASVQAAASALLDDTDGEA